jgi:hypothetical protein
MDCAMDDSPKKVSVGYRDGLGPMSWYEAAVAPDNPFELGKLAARPAIVRLDDAGWKEAKAVMERRGWTGDIDAIEIPGVLPGGRLESWPIRKAIDAALNTCLLSREIRKEWPIANRSNIRDDLTPVRNALDRAYSAFRNQPAVRVYGPRGLSDLKGMVDEIAATLKAIEAGTELPGAMAPKDGPIAEGFQRLHYASHQDPDEWLIFMLAGIFEEAFGRKAAASARGPAIEFVEIVSRPVQPAVNILYCLDKRSKQEHPSDQD